MELKPNAYRVRYRRMEGNNYAGGWVEYSKDIKDLGDLERFSDVLSVKPIFVHVFDEEISKADIDQAIANRKAERERQRKLDEVARAERELAEAKARLST